MEPIIENKKARPVDPRNRVDEVFAGRDQAFMFEKESATADTALPIPASLAAGYFSNKKSYLGITITSIVIALLVLGGGLFAYIKNTRTTTEQNRDVVPNQNPIIPDTTVATTPVITNTKYKDGTYFADGTYQSPGGTESITVTLVLKNDVIIDATVVGNATRKESIGYQSKFISGFKQYAVGKNIDEVSVDKVSGSSLTPKGFNDALAKIKVQAA